MNSVNSVNCVSKCRGCGHYSIKGPWVYCDEQGVERRRAEVGAQVTACQAAGGVQEWGIYIYTYIIYIHIYVYIYRHTT